MRNTYQILKWDTDFFGFVVARIIPHRLTAEELEDTLTLLKKQNVSLAYWASDPLDKESQRLAKLFGGFLADKKTTYEIDFRNAPDAYSKEANADIEEYSEPLPNPELEALALKSGLFSRFNIDPKFSKEQYENLYKLWILNSVNKKIADTIFVAKNRGKIVGMVTVSKKNFCGHIGIIAVDENIRGKNVGTDLVSMAQRWLVTQGCKTAQVVTQGDNTAGCRLYEKCGYHIKKIEYLYHFWLQLMKIPFNKPFTTGKELKYIQQAIDNMHISGRGPFAEKCQTFLEQILGVPKILLTTSCTHALEMTAILLNIQPGDEVIVPSFTFVSTVNAFTLRGARPIFIDIRPDTLNLDETQLEQLITPRSKVIVPVHYAGVGCEMSTILQVAEHHGVAVVEDNAHGLFGKYKGKYLGTFGCLATQSFHETKNFICGEGGALIINEPQYIEQAEIICEKGTNRNRFFRGQVDKYTWIDLGSSYLPSDILAAFLYAQLKAKAQIQAKRRRAWEYYYKHLQNWAQDQGIRLPIIPAHCKHPYNMFYLIMPSLEHRQRLIAHMKTHNIISVFHYQPLHLSKMGQRFGYKKSDCPVTEFVSDRLLRLPFYNDLTESEQAYVVTVIKEFVGK